MESIKINNAQDRRPLSRGILEDWRDEFNLDNCQSRA